MDLFEEVLAELEEENSRRQDIIMPLSNLRMREDGNLFSEDYGLLEVSDEAFKSLAKSFKLNYKHLKLLEEEGLMDNVANQFNYFFENKGMGNKKKLRMIDNRIKGIVSPNYSGFDDLNLLHSLGEIRESIPELQLSDFYREDKRTHARFILEDTNRIVGYDSIEDGNPDNMQIGFDIQNSEIGHSSIQINPMLYRLVCSNGMRMATPNGDKISRSQSNFTRFDMERNIRDSVELSIQESNNTINQVQKSKDVRIADPYEEIKRIGKEERITQNDILGIQETFDIEPQDNLFGIVNSFTRYGRILEEENDNNEGRIKFEDLAGRLLERVN